MSWEALKFRNRKVDHLSHEEQSQGHSEPVLHWNWERRKKQRGKAKKIHRTGAKRTNTYFSLTVGLWLNLI